MKQIITINEPHPIFMQTKNRSLFLASEHIERLHQYQQYNLRRKPADLRCHVQFIFSLIRQADVKREEIFAAIADLFIVLDGGGLALRQRMLNIARPFLYAEDITFFQQHLKQGIGATTPLPISCPSILTEAYVGHANHIQRSTVEQASDTLSEHEQALELIESGDLSSAAHILKKLLYQQANNEQIAEDLLNTLRHAGLEQQIAEVQDWFIENNLPLPNCWPLF